MEFEHNTPPVVSGQIADLQNVGIAISAIDRLLSRQPHMPGLGVMHGPSGYGKTLALARATSEFGAVSIEMRDTWTKKTLLANCLRVLGITPAARAPAAELLEQLSFALSTPPFPPLLIDEADKLVDHGMIEMIRDLYEMSRAAILLVGEEQLPSKLRRFERVHNRVLVWAPAQPCSIDDARLLRQLYARRAPVADDLLDRIVGACKGNTRRVSVNLELTQEVAATEGWETVTLARWGSRPLYTGETARRNAPVL